MLDELLNTLRPRQNGRHFPDDIFKCLFLNENVWISIKISLKFVPEGPIIFLKQSFPLTWKLMISMSLHAKLWSDWIIRIKLGPESVFTKFQLWAGTSFVKWDCGPEAMSHYGWHFSWQFFSVVCPPLEQTCCCEHLLLLSVGCGHLSDGLWASWCTLNFTGIFLMETLCSTQQILYDWFTRRSFRQFLHSFYTWSEVV